MRVLGTSDSNLRFDFAETLLPPPVVPQPPTRSRRAPLLPPMWIPHEGSADESFEERPSRLARQAILPPCWIPAQAVLAPPPAPTLPAQPLPTLLQPEPTPAPVELLPVVVSPAITIDALTIDPAPTTGRTARFTFRFMPVLMVSLCLHLVAMIVMAAINFTPQGKELVTILSAAFSDQEELVQDVIQVTEVTPPLEDVELIVADPGVGEELIAAEIEVGDTMAAGPLAADSPLQTDDVSKIDGLLGGLGDGMQSAGRGRPQPNMAQFFGIKATGKKFVFIVDNSGSMYGEKFAATKRELAYTISRLGPEQSFYVIFFNSEMVKMVLPPDKEPPTNVVPVTVANIKKFNQWLEKMTTDGGTDPYEAVEFAMSIKPDAIFILSDGQFSDGGRTLSFLDNANYLYDPELGDYRPRVNIHTIAFWDRGGEPTMKEIARLHKGTYRFVPERRKK